MDWRPISDIPGYEEFTNYELNIQGELRNIKNGKLRKWSPDKDGYMRAYLKQLPAKKHITQHRAICCLFLPNPFNLPQVDHINRKPRDNRIENLEWATCLEQMHNQGVRITNTTGEPNICAKFNGSGKPIWQIQMRFKGKDRTKTFPRDPTSNVIPQEVIDFRDAMQLEIEAELENERNNLILTL
jgi:hypothetical protein